jgi:hypothetical protein
MFQADPDSISHAWIVRNPMEQQRSSDLSSRAMHRFHAQRFAFKKLRNTTPFLFKVNLFLALAPSQAQARTPKGLYFFSLSLASTWSRGFGTTPASDLRTA